MRRETPPSIPSRVGGLALALVSSLSCQAELKVDETYGVCEGARGAIEDLTVYLSKQKWNQVEGGDTLTDQPQQFVYENQIDQSRLDCEALLDSDTKFSAYCTLDSNDGPIEIELHTSPNEDTSSIAITYPDGTQASALHTATEDAGELDEAASCEDMLGGPIDEFWHSLPAPLNTAA